MTEVESPRGAVHEPPLFYQDPLAFVQEVLGEQPYDKQAEILRAVAQHRRVSVVGCNGSGKDWAAARAVMWWIHAHSPARAIITGPTSRQVDDILWNELRAAYSRAPDWLKQKARMFRTARYELDEQTFALGFATDSPYNLQGFHSPNLLAVVTEAHAVRDGDFNAIRRLNPSRLLMTGNPFVAAGTFYDSHHSRRELYHTIQISAFDTPNVREGRIVVPGMITLQDIADRKEEWGEDDPLYIGAVLGRFPDNLDDAVVPLRAATEAVGRGLTPEGPVIVGCDVARFGKDLTVAVRRQGPVARIAWRVRGKDTMQVAGFLKSYCEQNDVDWLVVDDTGVGGGVVDRLREERMGHTRLVPFIAAQRAQDDAHFTNRLAEVWWTMRKGYLSGQIDTEDDRALVGQVSSRRYEWDGQGRIRLQGKESMSRSPDEADALAMTFAITRGGVKIWV
jgi:phage terminase large subunit